MVQPNTMRSTIIISGIFLIVFIAGCSKSDTTVTPPPPANPCTGLNLTPVATKTHTITGQSLGTITVGSPIGSGFKYSIDGTNFQASTNFYNLASGNFTLTAKNADNCTGTASVTINGYGPKFYAVRTIVNGYCGPCHLNGSTSGGKNFDLDSDVTGSWDRIKIRSVDGTPTYMPQGGQLTTIDKQKIVDWVNAGHRISD